MKVEFISCNDSAKTYSAEDLNYGDVGVDSEAVHYVRVYYPNDVFTLMRLDNPGLTYSRPAFRLSKIYRKGSGTQLKLTL